MKESIDCSYSESILWLIIVSWKHKEQFERNCVGYVFNYIKTKAILYYAATNKNSKLRLLKGNGYGGKYKSSPLSVRSNRQIEDNIIASNKLIFAVSLWSEDYRLYMRCKHTNNKYPQIFHYVSMLTLNWIHPYV